MLGQVERAVQRGLPAHGRQDRVRLFLGDNFFNDLPGNRLDVGRIRHVRIGHDGGRIRVHQNDAVTLFAQRLAGLRTGVVKLASLSNDNGAGADD